MTYFIRKRGGTTIVDIDLLSNLDISVSIDIEEYSKLLLEQPGKQEQQKIIRTFSFLSELRGWLHEVFFATKNNKNMDSMKAQISKILNDICDDLSLVFIED